jgi:predicted component of type VI protein secretion system
MSQYKKLEEIIRSSIPQEFVKIYDKANSRTIDCLGYPENFIRKINFSSDKSIKRPLFIFYGIKNMSKEYSTYFNVGVVSVLNSVSISTARTYIDYLSSIRILKMRKFEKSNIYKLRDIKKIDTEIERIRKKLDLVWKPYTDTILSKSFQIIEERWRKLQELIKPIDFFDEEGLNRLCYISYKDLKRLILTL